MYLANDSAGNRVYIDEAKKEKKYFCPLCGGEVIVKRGDIRIPHFAHKSDIECDDWANDMSEWHRDWQKQFPMNNREVIVENNGQKHRADVRVNNHIIEFQHSYITEEEFLDRNAFYTEAGYYVIWIFDFEEIWNSDNRIERSKSGMAYRWKWHWKMFDTFDPQREKNVRVLFQISNAKKYENNLGRWSWKDPEGDYIAFNEWISPISFIRTFDIGYNVDTCEKKKRGTSLLDILRNSNSAVVIAKNVITNRRVKVKNYEEYKNKKPSIILGYIGQMGSYSFFQDRRQIYGWEKEEWKLEWQSPLRFEV